MAFFTYRLNIKPVLLSITEVMMINFCVLDAVNESSAFVHSGLRNITSFNFTHYCPSSLVLFWIEKFFYISPTDNSKSSFFALPVLFARRLARVCVIICSPFFFVLLFLTGNYRAFLANMSESILSCFVFMKAINRFVYLAGCTFSCYSQHIHDFLLNRTLWLKPFASNELATGLFYSNIYGRDCQ